MIERGLLGKNTKGDDEEEEDDYRNQKKKEDKDFGLKSICRVIPEAEIKRMNAEDSEVKWQYQDYMFEKIELEEDTSYGMRAFNRNVDGLCCQLINFYAKAWPKQHQETV